MGLLDFAAEVEAFHGRCGPENACQGTAVQVVAFEFCVAERDDLGQEAVGADELVQGVLERQSVVVESVESLYGWVEEAVDPTVVPETANGSSTVTAPAAASSSRCRPTPRG